MIKEILCGNDVKVKVVDLSSLEWRAIPTLLVHKYALQRKFGRIGAFDVAECVLDALLETAIARTVSDASSITTSVTQQPRATSAVIDIKAEEKSEKEKEKEKAKEEEEKKKTKDKKGKAKKPMDHQMAKDKKEKKGKAKKNKQEIEEMDMETTMTDKKGGNANTPKPKKRMLVKKKRRRRRRRRSIKRHQKNKGVMGTRKIRRHSKSMFKIFF
jgi:hypothetical protein